MLSFVVVVSQFISMQGHNIREDAIGNVQLLHHCPNASARDQLSVETNPLYDFIGRE